MSEMSSAYAMRNDISFYVRGPSIESLLGSYKRIYDLRVFQVVVSGALSIRGL